MGTFSSMTKRVWVLICSHWIRDIFKKKLTIRVEFVEAARIGNNKILLFPKQENAVDK